MMPALLTALVLSGAPISLEFEGSLKDGLKQLAQKSEMNVMVVGDLDEPVQLHFPSIKGEDALSAIAETHGLEVTVKGTTDKIWVVRRIGSARPAPNPTAPEPVASPLPPTTISPPTPPLPPEPSVAGKRGRDRVSTGAPLTIESGATVKSAVVYGGPLTVEKDAVVEGDAVAFGGDVILEDGARVEGDAVSFGGNVVRAETAVIEGDSVSMGGAGFGAAIAKGVAKAKRESFERHQDDNDDEEPAAAPTHEEHQHDDSGSSHGFASFLLQFATLFGLGFLLMVFVPQRMKSLEDAIRADPTKNGLAGLVGLVALAPLTALLVVTVVGIPVALLMWLALAVAIPAGVAVIANVVGTRLPTGRIRKTQALVLALGLLVVLLISKIPVLGTLALVVAGCVSLGAIIRTRFGQPGRVLPTPSL